jgi:putative ABC transport system substrate-binding protein
MICKTAMVTALATVFHLIRSRLAIIFLASAALTLSLPAAAGSAENQKIVVVKSGDLKPYQDVLRGLRDGCGCDAQEAKFGSEEDKERILDSHPDAIVAIGTAAFRRVEAIGDIPIIYTMVIPSETAPPLRPYISGVSMDISPAVYLSWMKALFSKAKKIGLIYDSRNTAAFVGDAKKAAAAAGVELVTKQVSDASQIPVVLQGMQQNIDVFWMIPDPTVVTNEMVDYLLRFSFQNRIPIFTFSKKYVEQGAVASLDIDPYDMGEQAASIVNRVLAGQSAGSWVYARKSKLTINMKMATKLGLNLREDALSKVDKIE